MSGEKTLEPSKKKLDDSRKEGQVATSTDFMRSAVAIVVFEGARSLAAHHAADWAFMLQTACDSIVAISDGNDWSYEAPIEWVAASVYISVCLMAMAVIIWVMLSWLQTKGPVILEHPIALKLDKLNPLSYFKNVFSIKTLTTFGGNVFKSSLLSGLFIYAVFECFADFHRSQSLALTAALAIVGDRVTYFVRLSLWMMLALSTVDIWLQMKMLRRTLKMSHQDMKDEHKGMEGNAEVKQHVREIGNELLGEQPGTDPLQGSNALVVNPTHIAIGLYFSADSRSVPTVRVKKVEQAATELIERAQSTQVPVIRHLWLARTLYTHPLGQPVPRESYKTVAAIYKVIASMKESDIPNPKTNNPDKS